MNLTLSSILDLGGRANDFQMIVQTLKFMNKELSTFPKHKRFLLYDIHLDEDIIKKFRKANDESKILQTDKILPWETYVGCECDAVIFVGGRTQSYLTL